MVFIYILLCLSSLALIALVLMQEGKSGLGGLTGGTTMSTFGANTDKTLIKLTGFMATVFFTLVIVIHLANKGGTTNQKSLMPTAETKAKVESKEISIPKATDTKPEQPTGTSVTVPIKDAKEEKPADKPTK